jgi:hypothetical protein
VTEIVSREKARLRFFTYRLLLKHQPLCPECGEPFTWDDLPSRGIDKLTEHHLDGNHLNSNPANTVIVHRSCHKAHHVSDNVNKHLDMSFAEEHLTTPIPTLSPRVSKRSSFAPDQYVCEVCRYMKGACKCTTPQFRKLRRAR